jgi:hypothetical protein
VGNLIAWKYARLQKCTVRDQLKQQITTNAFISGLSIFLHKHLIFLKFNHVSLKHTHILQLELCNNNIMFSWQHTVSWQLFHIFTSKPACKNKKNDKYYKGHTISLLSNINLHIEIRSK